MVAELDLDDFDYELPPERIAQQPTDERESARLLVMNREGGPLLAERVSELPTHLRAGDLLVVNSTRVLRARLRGRKESGGGAGALLLGASPGASGRPLYRALVRSRGRLRVGQKYRFANAHDALDAEITELLDSGEVLLSFPADRSPYEIGEMPLPPYIQRDCANAADEERYQTTFARVPGAVAAPTAGLHLTASLLSELEQGGVEVCEVVLHVGPGTFRPLRPSELQRGRLHPEEFELSDRAADRVAETRRRGGRVVAVGTTSVRVLETCGGGDGVVRAARGSTDLFLRPGSRFRVVDALLTNFHLPRSSLLMLVSAFAGRERVLQSYAAAVRRGYRFYSYGDAMLIL